MNNLLILGAGGFGRTAAEAAYAMKNFDKISFLDDNSSADDVIGKLSDYSLYLGEYKFAYAAFGDNKMRSEWQQKLSDAGFTLCNIIHPTAYISPSAKLANGICVLPNAVINTYATVENGIIVNIGALIDHHCTLNEFTHIAPGAIIKAGNVVDAFSKIESGTVLERKEYVK